MLTVLLASDAVAQNPASATWTLQNVLTSTTSGAILTKDESSAGVALSYEDVVYNTVTYSAVQKIKPEATTSDVAGSGSWPLEALPNVNRYVQFVLLPKAGVSFTSDSLSMLIGAKGSNDLRAAIYFSMSSGFASGTLIVDTALASNAVFPVNYGFAANANSGDTLFVRVYPYSRVGISSTTKYLYLQAVTLYGQTFGTVAVELPTISTSQVTEISVLRATCGGVISSDGGGAITARGTCWNTSGNPTITDDTTNDGSGSGSFVSHLTGLSANTTYHVRAYATNSAGTAYGNELSFLTLTTVSVPTVTTTSITSILTTTAKSGGNVTAWGGDTVTSRGVCWNTTGNPTIADQKSSNGSGIGSFTSTLYNLIPNTTYYIRAYAMNKNGTGYGTTNNFTTQTPAPPVMKEVANDGSGDYTTVQAAFDAVPANYTGVYTIFVKKGTYYEKLLLGAGKVNVNLKGEDRDNTILTYDDYSGKTASIGTSTSYSVAIDADDFTAQDITFQNTSTAAQAVALRVNGDRGEYYNCRLLGFQDTYYTWGGSGAVRTYMKHCYIEGSVDFIFGRNIVVFDSCEIHENRNGGTLTAAATDPQSSYGYVFLNCTITVDSIGFDSNPIVHFYLGRPWQSSPRTVFINTYEPASLDPAGWLTWNVIPGLYAEFNCTGPGYLPAQRLTSISTQLSAPEAATYILGNIFSANTNPNFGYDWIPRGPVVTSVRGSNGNIKPHSYGLLQNYPNPFNPVTLIRYQLSVTTNVNLKVFDLLGREIETLVDEVQPTGFHVAVFDGSKCTSGIYLCKLEAGNFTSTRKMLLLK